MARSKFSAGVPRLLDCDLIKDGARRWRWRNDIPSTVRDDFKRVI